MEPGDRIINDLNIVHNMTKKVDVPIFPRKIRIDTLEGDSKKVEGLTGERTNGTQVHRSFPEGKLAARSYLRGHFGAEFTKAVVFEALSQ